jgi:hypothetical protein
MPLYAYHLFCSTFIRQTSHPDNDLSAPSEKSLSLVVVASCYVDEIFAICFGHLDVSLVDVMFVPFERHVSMLLIDKSHDSFPVTTSESA